MPKIKAVIFDLDDTLFDCTGQLVEQARKRAARAFVESGLPLTEQQAYKLQIETIKKFGDKGDVFERILEKFPVYNKSAVLEKVLHEYNSDNVPKIFLFPEAKSLLRELKSKGIKTGIVTSGLPSRQMKKIRLLGLEKIVDFVIVHDAEKGTSKENCFVQALRKLSAKPQEAVSVGDRVFSEIKISNRLGTHTVQMLHGRFKDTKPKSDMEEADYKIKKLSELPGIIQKIENAKNNEPKIVLVGGGSGTSIMLSGLKKFTPNLTAIVTVTDTGRTTGIIRKELGIAGTGDIRNCLVALSENGLLGELFSYRFESGQWKGYSFGNIFLAALAKTTGSYKKALAEAGRILAIKGKVLPATLDNVHICVELEDGTIIEEEDKIVARDNDVSGRSPIKKAFLKPANAKALPDAIKAIREADAIIIGPGCLFTSIIPNLLVKGLSQAVKKSSAKKIYICNIMTQQGQTDNYPASMHVKKIEECLGKNALDFAIINSEKPEKKFLAAYEKENAFFVKPDVNEIKKLVVKAVSAKILQKGREKKQGENRREYLRHDAGKIAKVIMKII